MEIQVASDLHTNLERNRNYLYKNPIEKSADRLVLVGDTFHLQDDLEKYKKMLLLRRISEQFDEVFIVPGNHEYRKGFDIGNHKGVLDEKIPGFSNIRLVNNTAIEIEGVNLVFSTLWSHIKTQVESVINNKNLTDIQKNGKPIGVDGYNELHNENVRFLIQNLRNDINNIVFSHHLPLRDCIPKKYRNYDDTELYATNLSGIIEKYRISHWVYGHNHTNRSDFDAFGTTFVTNQLGKVKSAGEGLRGYKNDKILSYYSLESLRKNKSIRFDKYSENFYELFIQTKEGGGGFKVSGTRLQVESCIANLMKRGCIAL